MYLKLEIDPGSLIALLKDVISIKDGSLIFKESSLPIYIKPLLTHVISKGMLNQLTPIVPSLKVALTTVHPSLFSVFDLVDSEPDFTVMGHSHKYYGPACSYCDTTAELYEEAKAVDGKDLVTHKPCEANGGKSATEAFIEKRKKRVTDYFKNMSKKIVKNAAKKFFT